MPNVYVGNCEIEPNGQSSGHVDPYGMDRFSRTYEGRSDKLQAFLKQWPKGKPDIEFRQLKLIDSAISDNGRFVQVTHNFAGLKDGNLRDPVVSSSLRTQTVTLESFEGTTTADFEYKAPVTTYRYVATKEPEQPRFEGKIRLEKMSWQMRKQNGGLDIPIWQVHKISEFGGNVTYSDTRAGYFNYARDIMQSDFRVDPVGEYWEVTEQNEGMIIAVQRNNFPKWLQPLIQAQTSNF
jgi:hypothetical protein